MFFPLHRNIYYMIQNPGAPLVVDFKQACFLVSLIGNFRSRGFVLKKITTRYNKFQLYHQKKYIIHLYIMKKEDRIFDIILF